jgi:hypothetical protein
MTARAFTSLEFTVAGGGGNERTGANMSEQYDTTREGAMAWIAAAILPGLILTACATAQPVVLTSGGRSQPISLIADPVGADPSYCAVTTASIFWFLQTDTT